MVKVTLPPYRARVLRSLVWGFVVLICFALASTAQEAQEPVLGIDWTEGPSTGALGQVAQVVVPEGFLFAGADDTRKIMELMQNPVNGSELGFLSPAEEDWFIVFEFNDMGYVKDDEKGELDADAILDSIQAANQEANKVRREKGWETLDVLGWHHPPFYNEVTHNLEWATLARGKEGDVINHNTRLLGRKGVMSATLVAGPEQIESVLPASKSLLKGYEFVSGQRYSEFSAGDKIAEYGLTALITGGAAAVAVKSGLLKKLWKFILIGIVALVSFFKKILAALFGKSVRAEDAGSAADTISPQ